MRSVHFQHSDRGKTVSYRVDFYRVGEAAPAHSITTSSVSQSAVSPPTYAIAISDAQRPPSGIYEITVTANGALGSSTSVRSTPYATEQPPSAPGTVTVGY